MAGPPLPRVLLASAPQSGSSEEDCACWTRDTWETCLGTDVRACPSLNFHEEADLPAEATKSNGGALESDRPGRNPRYCLTMGQLRNVEVAQVCDVGQCWPLVTLRSTGGRAGAWHVLSTGGGEPAEDTPCSWAVLQAVGRETELRQQPAPSVQVKSWAPPSNSGDISWLFGARSDHEGTFAELLFLIRTE